MIRDIKLREIMVSPVITVGIEEEFSHVTAKLRDKKIRHLIVLDEKGKVAGIISERDVFRTVSPHRNEEGYVYDETMLRDFVLRRQMTPEPFMLRPDSKLSEALRGMIHSRYGCIPIVDENQKPVGVVTTRDVLKWLSRNVSDI